MSMVQVWPVRVRMDHGLVCVDMGVRDADLQIVVRVVVVLFTVQVFVFVRHGLVCVAVFVPVQEHEAYRAGQHNRRDDLKHAEPFAKPQDRE